MKWFIFFHQKANSVCEGIMHKKHGILFSQLHKYLALDVTYLSYILSHGGCLKVLNLIISKEGFFGKSTKTERKFIEVSEANPSSWKKALRKTFLVDLGKQYVLFYCCWSRCDIKLRHSWLQTCLTFAFWNSSCIKPCMGVMYRIFCSGGDCAGSDLLGGRHIITVGRKYVPLTDCYLSNLWSLSWLLTSNWTWCKRSFMASFLFCFKIRPSVSSKEIIFYGK